MAKKTGICMNLDCDNYKKEIEVEPGGEFECPLCHQPLRESRPRGGGGNTGSGKKKIMIIVGGLVVIAAVGIFLGMGGDKNTVPIKEKPVIVQPKVDSAKVDTPIIPVSPKEPEQELKKPQPAPSQSPKTKGTVDLGYGTYTGDLKNGKPHGYGIITYKTRCKIVSSKDFVANPGDTFEGDFRDGKISGLGYWNHDGNQTAVKP